ncbi:HEAT repeat domain-containing protein [Chitinophaga pinensis]|uniref:HEAT repeat domain-containing protein n=1 Tax=Chitinophaga pinensis TaxID=79329 RepID=UPI0021BD7501|nr:hypothetical protein [Chitinophaga pinensis]
MYGLNICTGPRRWSPQRRNKEKCSTCGESLYFSAYHPVKDKELPVRISAARAIAKLQIKQAGPALLASLQTDRDADMRVAALEALVSLQDAGMEQGITVALTDKEKAVRVAGLDLLSKCISLKM